MKTTLCFTLTLLTFVMLMFTPNSFAQEIEPEYVVRVIYFLPNDRQPQPDMDTRLDATIKEAQQFFADQMEAHGFGRKTFGFEADETGNVVVHHVNGKFDDAYYQHPSTQDMLGDEIEEVFDMSKNIYFVALDTNLGYIALSAPDKFGRGGTLGIAWMESRGGRLLIPASNHSAVLHELGHTFGLVHDGHTRKDANRIFASSIPTNDYMITTFCAAEWMNVSRYFNPTQEAYNEDTSVQMLKPSLAVPPSSVRLSFEVNDPDGLHQIQLFAYNRKITNSLIACKKVSGKSATVEFVTNNLEYTSLIALRVMDMNGNFSEHKFPIDITDFLPPPEAISIPDPILAAAVRKTLSLAPDDVITQIDMLNLRGLSGLRVSNNHTKDLTGLEHAINLSFLHFDSISQPIDLTPLVGLPRFGVIVIYSSQITDITSLEGLMELKLSSLTIENSQITDFTPIAAFTEIKGLDLGGNEISDITFLAALKHLRSLWIGDNQISDINPLMRLTSLRTLSLRDNRISDINPLAGLKHLDYVDLHNNQISDIIPLTKLTNLERLYLQDNQINDIKPLAGLKRLQELKLHKNKISDITPLAELTFLHYKLNLRNNQISDVSPLADLVNLKELRLEGNPIKDREPLLALLRKNPDVKIYLKYGDEPLPVNLSHFRAEHTDAGVVLKWITESEVDNAGFYIHRSDTKDGEFKVVNPTMIQGAGTTSERNAYTWTDTTAKPNVVYYYQIEDISHAGVRKQLATVRMRGLVSASGKLTTRWADLKTQN